jgi:hypothetical protein
MYVPRVPAGFQAGARAASEVARCLGCWFSRTVSLSIFRFRPRQGAGWACGAVVSLSIISIFEPKPKTFLYVRFAACAAHSNPPRCYPPQRFPPLFFRLAQPRVMAAHCHRSRTTRAAFLPAGFGKQYHHILPCARETSRYKKIVQLLAVLLTWWSKSDQKKSTQHLTTAAMLFHSSAGRAAFVEGILDAKMFSAAAEHPPGGIYQGGDSHYILRLLPTAPDTRPWHLRSYCL